MIVVDTNVVHYCWVRGQFTDSAQAIRRKDPDWHAPILWRSEMRNVLAAYIRRRLLTPGQALDIMDAADNALADRQHIVADGPVLDIVATTELTAYDAEFVALAAALSAPLVTADKAVLKAFPERAVTMQTFLRA